MMMMRFCSYGDIIISYTFSELIIFYTYITLAHVVLIVIIVGRRFLTKLVNSFIGHVSERSPASLCLRKARHRSVCGSFLAALAMLTVYMLVSVNRISLLVSSILLFISSLVSVSILSWNVYLRQTELIKGLQAVKDSISFQNMEAVNEGDAHFISMQF